MQLPTAEPCSLTPGELDASPLIKPQLALILLPLTSPLISVINSTDHKRSPFVEFPCCSERMWLQENPDVTMSVLQTEVSRFAGCAADTSAVQKHPKGSRYQSWDFHSKIARKWGRGHILRAWAAVLQHAGLSEQGHKCQTVKLAVKTLEGNGEKQTCQNKD